ncbi:MAG: alkaline phosphatase family protein [bacterium]
MNKEKKLMQIQNTGLKVFIIGVDGMTWKIAQPLLDNEEMPNLQKLINNGTRAILRSEGNMNSPIMWTNIITGKDSSMHGISGFITEALPFFPKIHKLPPYIDLRFMLNRLGIIKTVTVCSYNRKVKALWNILSDADKTVGVVGWGFASWPAEQVNGYIVTHEITHVREAYKNKKFREIRYIVVDAYHPKYGITFPSKLVESLEPLSIEPRMVNSSSLFDKDDFSLRNVDKLSEITEGVESYLFESLFIILAEDMTAFHIMKHMQNTQNTEFSVVYFRITDVVGHIFFRYFKPELKWKLEPTHETVRLFNQTINNSYRLFDKWLGKLTNNLPPDTVVIICSDHGMGPSIKTEYEPDVSGSHTMDGLLLLSGGPVRKKHTMKQSRQFDLAPTILYLMGLPVAKDMKGKILENAIEPEFLEKFHPTFIDTYETKFKSNIPHVPRNQNIEKMRFRQLRELKYLE